MLPPAQPKAASVTPVTTTTTSTTTTTTAVDRNSSSSATPANAAVKPATDGEGLSSVDFPLLSASVTHPKRGSGSTKHASTKCSSGPEVAAPQEAQWVAVAEPRNQLMTPGSAAGLPAKGSSTALSYSRIINSTHTAAGSQDIRNSTHTAAVSQDIRNSLTASKSAAPGQLTHRDTNSNSRNSQHGASTANSSAPMDQSSQVHSTKGHNKRKKKGGKGGSKSGSASTTAPLDTVKSLRSPGSAAETWA